MFEDGRRCTLSPEGEGGVRGNWTLELTGPSEFVHANSTPFHLCSVCLPARCSTAICVNGSLAAAGQLNEFDSPRRFVLIALQKNAVRRRCSKPEKPGTRLRYKYKRGLTN